MKNKKRKSFVCSNCGERIYTGNAKHNKCKSCRLMHCTNCMVGTHCINCFNTSRYLDIEGSICKTN